MEDKNQNAANHSEPKTMVEEAKDHSADATTQAALATAAVRITEASESAKRQLPSDPE